MSSSSQYSIIGSGNIGSALARLFDHAKIDVSIANTRGPESMRSLLSTVGSHVDAVDLDEALHRDVVILAVPFAAISEIAQAREDWTGTTVVDATNAVYSPGSSSALAGRTGSQFVADHFRGAEVVKSFNQLPAQVLSSASEVANGKQVVFVSSDSKAASSRIADLIGELGLASIELGPINDGGLLIEAPNALVLRNLVER